MLKACKSGTDDFVDYGVCLGRLDGFRSGLYIGGAYGAADVICYPNGVTLGQQADVLRAYLSRHPERRHVMWHFLALHAFAEAWPCAGAFKVIWDTETGLPSTVPK
ncbi:Rap1a/Tai family immunity protein [Qipengyuania gaetbuli]|uniref:Rap1a/Tai family immunity protein n=1 Tax=Qipengyuania gaetbuli TaxID=266952 RepID=UPI001C9A2046